MSNKDEYPKKDKHGRDVHLAEGGPSSQAGLAALRGNPTQPDKQAEAQAAAERERRKRD